MLYRFNIAIWFLKIYPILLIHVCKCDNKQRSELEVRSVFLKCDLEDLIAFPDSDLTRYQRQEILKHNILRDCKDKLAVTVKMCNIPTITGDEFIPIDHILSAHNKRIRLLNPYILRLRRELPSQIYKIKKLDVVTGEFSSMKRDILGVPKIILSHFKKKYYEDNANKMSAQTVYNKDTDNVFSDDRNVKSFMSDRLYRNIKRENGNNVTLPKHNKFVLYEIGNGDLWYKAKIEIYEKMTRETKPMWIDLTADKNASVSTIDPTWSNRDISIRFNNRDVLKGDFVLPTGSLCLVLPYTKENLPKDIKINNGEFIIVPISDVVVVKSTREGTNRSDNRKQRHVVIETTRTLMYGDMADLIIMENGGDKYLKLPLRNTHCAEIDLEVKADDNKLIVPGVVTRECTPRISEVREDVEKSLIPPMHTNIFMLKLQLDLSHNDYRCSIVLLSEDGGAVATRDVSVKKNDRCFCIWQCDCVCLGDDPKLICRDMPEVEILAAGFSPYEGTRRVRSACYPDVVTIDMFVIFFGVLCLLFLLGLLKACVGLILPCVGIIGLEFILKLPRKLDRYYESRLKDRPVVYDIAGWPVHPDTNKRTVRLVSRSMEFTLNVIMFIILPCILIWDALTQLNKCKDEDTVRTNYQNTKKCFSTQDVQNVEPRWRRRKGDTRKWMTPHAEALSADIWHYGLCENNDYKQSLLNELPVTIEKQTNNDSEQDDTAYVLTQIQKSKDSLRN